MKPHLDRSKLQDDIHALYNREHAALGQAGTLAHLERGQEFKLSGTLEQGGVLVFPHVGVDICGYQVAACVQACLDSGADTVMVISVLHAFSEEMEGARQRVAAGGEPSREAAWGIQGPGLAGGEAWRGDHALMSWRYFWQAEVERRGLDASKVPRVIERYPYLAGGRPEALPGIEELQTAAKDAVIVSTADPFHHGIGYGTPANEAFEPDKAGLAKAKQRLEEGITLLERGDYWSYNQHCVQVKSDARDAGQVFRYIRGPMTGRVADLTYSDATELYNAPPPTWVASAIFEWQLA